MVEPTHPWLAEKASRLCREFDCGQLGHAPMLHGPRGIGKQRLAHMLATSILCQARTSSSQPTERACGSCAACQMISAASHPDFFVVSVLEDAKEIVVDQVRALIEKVALTPAAGKHRVVVIEAAERMNLNAANALLKTLEEPPNNVWLILVSHAPGRLPPTVLSRCQKYAVQPPPIEVARDWLDVQGGAFDSEQRRLALKLSAGAPCLALEHLESGLTETAGSVLGVLVEIARGHGVRPDVPSQWAEQAHSVWTCLAHWISELATAQVLTSESDQLTELLHKPHRGDWSGLWSSALEGLATTDSGVRQDLLLGRWLLVWESQWLSA